MPFIRTLPGSLAESKKEDPGWHSCMHHNEAAPELPGWNPYHPCEQEPVT